MTSTQMARRLSAAALQYRENGSAAALLELESLARGAVVHVRRAGQGTVDHIVLSATLRLIVVDVPALEAVLRESGWSWL
jgi:hypothetical protein